jgi:hypothetical protein
MRSGAVRQRAAPSDWATPQAEADEAFQSSDIHRPPGLPIGRMTADGPLRLTQGKILVFLISNSNERQL